MNKAKTIKKTVPVLSYIGKILIGLLIISPIILAFFMSFMTPAEMATIPPTVIPESFSGRTYEKALQTVPLFKFLINSFIVCAVVIIAQVITCCLAAYAFSFFEFTGKNFLFFIILLTMMIPADAIIIANFLTVSGWGLKDSYMGLVVPYLTSAMGIFLMRQYFLTIPKELQEAATIDGCGNFRFLFNIIIPMSTPSIASLAIYIFIQTYNQFLWPLLVTDSIEMRTVQIGMSILQQAEAVDYSVVLAGAMLILIPAIIVFIIGHRYLIAGMTAGAVKG